MILPHKIEFVCMGFIKTAENCAFQKQKSYFIHVAIIKHFRFKRQIRKSSFFHISGAMDTLEAFINYIILKYIFTLNL